MRNALLALGLTCFAASPPAWGSPWYAGGALGVSDFGGCPAAASCDSRDQAYKVYAGYRFTPHLAVEAGYSDLGKTTVSAGSSVTETKPRGMAAHAVGSWPLTERFSLLGRVGLIYGDTKVTGSAPTRNEKGAEFAWGAGVQLDVAPQIAVRLEWERFEFRDAVDTLTLGVVARF